MKKQRTKVSREFKLEAVRLLELGEKPAAQLALELGIRRSKLYAWRAALGRKGDEAFRGPGRNAAKPESDVARLRRELERVTEERDILTKAAAYFAKQLP